MPPIRRIGRTRDYCYYCDRYLPLRELEEKRRGIHRPVLVCRDTRACDTAQGKR